MMKRAFRMVEILSGQELSFKVQKPKNSNVIGFDNLSLSGNLYSVQVEFP
jgi:hypothetical protein